MNRIIHFIVCCFFLTAIGNNITAQPSAYYYQAIAKDHQGNPARNRTIHVKCAIVQGTSTNASVYEETHQVNSNGDGVFQVVVGQGTVVNRPGLLAAFSAISWGNGPYFFTLKIAVAPSIPAPWWVAGDNYIDMGISQILSVPYAMYSGNASVTDVTRNIPAGPPNSFLITDSLGNVNWNTPPAARVPVTFINSADMTSVIAGGQNIRIDPNTTKVISLTVPGAKRGDPILISSLDDYVGWSVYNAWVSADGIVSIRFANFTKNPVDVLGSQYKILVVK